MSTDTPSADQIRSQMAEVRHEMDRDIKHITQSVSVMMDWTSYVRQYPWASVGVAAALGYLIVPQRVEIRNPDVKTLEKLAKRNELFVGTNPSPEAKGGILGAIFTMAAGTLMRGAFHYLAGKAGEMLQDHSEGGKTPTETLQETAEAPPEGYRQPGLQPVRRES